MKMSMDRFPIGLELDVIDLFRIEGGKLAEHWDVLQNEMPVTEALGGISMFDPSEGTHADQPGAQSTGAQSIGVHLVADIGLELGLSPLPAEAAMHKQPVSAHQSDGR